MNTPLAETPTDSIRPRLHGAWRVVLLIVGTAVGTLLVAACMIQSEWDGLSQPAFMRMLIALMTAAIMLPGVIPAFWWKPLWPALAGMFVPATVAAFFAARLQNEDYSFLIVGVPVMIAGGLLMMLILPPRPYLAGRGKCHSCGYDLHMAPRPRCPECGAPWDGAAQLRMPVRIHRRWLLIGLLGFAIAGTLQWLFTSFLLSLG